MSHWFCIVGGFGRAAVQRFRSLNNLLSLKTMPAFPLTLGRDFSGVVAQTGKSVQNYKPGDEVFMFPNLLPFLFLFIFKMKMMSPI